ncbi:MAG TPA: STAS domain-containing protein [Micromonosporaceae bacterium]
MRTGRDGSTAAAVRTPLVEVIFGEELDARAAARLHVLLGEALALRPEQLVVDLSGCPFADAVGIDVLLEAHRRTWLAGGRLVLRAPSPRLRRILRLARVDEVFHITDEPAPQPPPDRRGPLTAHPPRRGGG